MASPPQDSFGLQSYLSIERRERRDERVQRQRTPDRCYVASYDLASEALQFHFCHVLLVEVIELVHQVQGEGNRPHGLMEKCVSYSL